jgi:hypothetical protein
MQKIPVSKVVGGMVLARPVTRESGVVLMGEGTELTELLIEKLRDLEIANVYVKGRPLDLGGEDVSLEQLLNELDERFSITPGDKLSLQIKELVKQDIIRRRSPDEL